MATETPATQAKRVLVVEDEPTIRILLEDMLGELYGELPKPYRDRPTLRKPFQIDGLKGMLQSTLHSASQ